MATFNARKIRETARAVLLSVEFAHLDGIGYATPFEYTREVWFPLSKLTDNGDGTFSVPNWLARDRGLTFSSWNGPGVNGAC